MTASSSNCNLKVYLDQKDYSCIARGLNRESGYEKYREIYDTLLGLVNDKRITVYFSVYHIIESLRYGGIGGELWDLHCDVVDTLTNGHCLISKKNLIERELNLFLSREFNFQPSFVREEYPYGKFKDAVHLGSLGKVSIKGEITKALNKTISKSGLNRNQRRNFCKKHKPVQHFRKQLLDMDEDDFTALVKQTQEGEKKNNFSEDFFSMLDRESAVSFIFGSYQKRQQIVNRLFEEVFHFKKLVQRYGKLFPQLVDVAKIPEKNFVRLEEFISKIQEAQSMFGKSLLAEVDFRKIYIDIALKKVRKTINAEAKRNKFSSKEAVNMLSVSELADIPVLSSWLTFMHEYLIKHDVKKRARTPKGSDPTDMGHLALVPYVDYFMTDNFMCGLVKQKAASSYGTTVCHNLEKLCSRLVTIT